MWNDIVQYNIDRETSQKAYIYLAPLAMKVWGGWKFVVRQKKSGSWNWVLNTFSTVIGLGITVRPDKMVEWNNMVANFCHRLSDLYVDLSDLYVDLSYLYGDLLNLYVVLSDLYTHVRFLFTCYLIICYMCTLILKTCSFPWPVHTS